MFARHMVRKPCSLRCIAFFPFPKRFFSHKVCWLLNESLLYPMYMGGCDVGRPCMDLFPESCLICEFLVIQFIDIQGYGRPRGRIPGSPIFFQPTTFLGWSLSVASLPPPQPHTPPPTPPPAPFARDYKQTKIIAILPRLSCLTSPIVICVTPQFPLFGRFGLLKWSSIEPRCLTPYFLGPAPVS